jgi:hypothetical protein
LFRSRFAKDPAAPMFNLWAIQFKVIVFPGTARNLTTATDLVRYAVCWSEAQGAM